MSNTRIHRCENCSQYYCWECSEHSEWEHFCCKECAKEFEEKKNGGK